MLISLIIPVYNIENYIRKCIDSCIAQTYRDIEIILIDDGSSDSCKVICDDYSKIDSRIVVIHKENGGLVSARKKGLSIANGNWSMFIDGDDWIDESCVEKCVDIVTKYNVELVCFASTYIYENSEKEKHVNTPMGFYGSIDIKERVFPFLIEDSFGKRFNMSAWGKMYNTEKLREAYIGVDDRITMGEDAVVVRPYLLYCNSMYVMSDTLYNYNRTNVTSMTRLRKPLSWENARLVHERQKNVFGSLGDLFAEQIKRNYIHNLYLVALSQFVSQKGYKTTRKEIITHLNDSYIKMVSSQVTYKSIKHRIMLMSIRYKLTILMYAHFMFRQFKSVLVSS